MTRNPTEREVQILGLIAMGLTNSEIGSLLFISAETVKSHVRHLLDKLHARNRKHLIYVGVKEGWLTITSTERTKNPSPHSQQGLAIGWSLEPEELLRSLIQDSPKASLKVLQTTSRVHSYVRSVHARRV